MPTRPIGFCLEDGCRVRVNGRCPTHRQQARMVQRRNYTGVPGISYGRPWQRVAQPYLRDHVWCVLCPHDRKQLATEVDHVVPHQQDPNKYWDQRNWQALCKPCHARKSLAETRANHK